MKTITASRAGASLAIALSTAIVNSAAAQSETGETSSASEVRVLEQVVVTAQKREENVQEVPLSVAVLSSDELSRSQINFVSDVPNQSPSINLEKKAAGMGLNFAMRGIGAFAPTAGIQPGIGMVVDGSPLLRGFEFDMELPDVENIQLLMGPQGTLFGASTIGGVVNITSKRPTDTFEGYVEAVATTDEEQSLRVGLSGPLSEAVRGRLVAYGRDREGYIKNLYPGSEPDGGEESYGANGSLQIDITDNVDVTLRGDFRRYTSTDNTHLRLLEPGVASLPAALGNGDPALGRRIAGDPGLNNSDTRQWMRVKGLGGAVDLNWRLSDTWSVKSLTSYRQTDMRQNIDIDNTPATASNPLGLAFVTVNGSNTGSLVGANIEYLQQELRLQYSGEAVDGLVGVYYSNVDEAVGVGNRLTTVPLLLNSALFLNNTRRGELSSESYAAFADLTWHITDALDLFAGFRWTDETLTNDLYGAVWRAFPGQYTVSGRTINVNPGVAPASITDFTAKTSNGEWSARTGGLWHVTPDVNVYVTLSRGFTSAGANTQVTATPSTAFIDPSTAESLEIGAKSTLLGHRLVLNVAAFNIEQKDIQASQFDPATSSFNTISAGDFRSRGVELDMTALLGDRFSFGAAATLLDTAHSGGLLQPCWLGQTAELGCQVLPNGLRVQNLDGKSGVNAPDLRYTLRGTYDLPLSAMPFDLTTTLTYVWSDGRMFELINDPIGSYQGSYDTLDVTFALNDKQGRYSVSVFGKNVLDEHFMAFSQSEAGRNARARGYYPRAAFAYWGLKATYNF